MIFNHRNQREIRGSSDEVSCYESQGISGKLYCRKLSVKDHKKLPHPANLIQNKTKSVHPDRIYTPGADSRRTVGHAAGRKKRAG